MEELDIINEIITMILKDRTDLKIKIAFSDDLYRDALRVCDNPAYLEYLNGLPQMVKTELNQATGMYILPKDLQSNQYILIDSAQKENGYSHYTAIAAEVLSAKNHTIFCEKYCDGDVNKISESSSYKAFQIWNAFDTRRSSHRLHLSLVLQQLCGYEMAEVSNLLRERELPERLQEINVLLTEKNSVSQYKRIAAILGMFHVWETAYDIPIAPHMNIWCYTLYEALKKYGAINVVDFSALDDEINQLWMQRG